MNCICPSFTETEMVLPLSGHGSSGEKNLEYRQYRDLILEQGLLRYVKNHDLFLTAQTEPGSFFAFGKLLVGHVRNQNQTPT